MSIKQQLHLVAELPPPTEDRCFGQFNFLCPCASLTQSSGVCDEHASPAKGRQPQDVRCEADVRSAVGYNEEKPGHKRTFLRMYGVRL